MSETSAPATAPVPAHVPERLVFPFDFRADPGKADNIWAPFASLNTRPDVFWSPELGGFWVATRAPIIEEVFRRHDIFTSRSVMIPASMSSGAGIVNNEDPPEYQRFRSILANKIFSPRALAGVEDYARLVTRDLLDDIVPRGKCDFIRAFTRPMPVDVFMRMFGMERSLRLTFSPWVEQFFRAQNHAEIVEARDNIIALLTDWIDDLLADPDGTLAGSDDEGHVMRALLAAEVDGRRISRQEMLLLSLLLVNAALDTTTAQMTHQMAFLAEHSEHRDALIGDPSLIPHAVEAMLRRFGMVNTGRMVRDDMTFHGVEMRAGEMVLCSTAIAGLDRQSYPDPLQVSFDKDGGRTKH